MDASFPIQTHLLASRLSRALARAIDVAAAGIYLFVAMFLSEITAHSSPRLQGRIFLGFILVAVVVKFRMDAGGQTLGKRIQRIRVRTLDDEPLTFSKRLLRGLILDGLPLGFFVFGSFQEEFASSMFYVWMFSIPLMLVVNAIDAHSIVWPERRCQHDFFAGTAVVRALPERDEFSGS